MATRVGKTTFDIPQVRESNFYPQALEKGPRSERLNHDAATKSRSESGDGVK